MGGVPHSALLLLSHSSCDATRKTAALGNSACQTVDHKNAPPFLPKALWWSGTVPKAANIIIYTIYINLQSMKLLGNILLGLAPLSISFLFIDFSKCLFFLFRQRFKTVSKAWKILANVYSEHTHAQTMRVYTHTQHSQKRIRVVEKTRGASRTRQGYTDYSHAHTHTHSHACT